MWKELVQIFQESGKSDSAITVITGWCFGYLCFCIKNVEGIRLQFEIICKFYRNGPFNICIGIESLVAAETDRINASANFYINK